MLPLTKKKKNKEACSDKFRRKGSREDFKGKWKYSERIIAG